MDVIEAMETCSAVRYLKPDPVPQRRSGKCVAAAGGPGLGCGPLDGSFSVLCDL